MKLIITCILLLAIAATAVCLGATYVYMSKGQQALAAGLSTLDVLLIAFCLFACEVYKSYYDS